MKPFRLAFEGYTHAEVIKKMISTLEKEGYRVTKKYKGPTEVIQTGVRCEKCGGLASEKKGITDGKPWHAVICWSGDKAHTKWLNENVELENRAESGS